MLEHMHKTITVKDGKHSMGYGYLLTKVFNYFGVPLGKEIKATVKQTISLSTLNECDCVEERTGSVSKVSELLIEQEQLKHELDEMRALLSIKDVKIACLNGQLLKVQIAGLGSSELATLKAQNDSFTTHVAELKEKLLKTHVEVDARLILVLQSLTPKPRTS